MAELVALWMVWNKIAAIAHSRGVRARSFQVRAVVLWFAFEFVAGFVAAAIGFEGVLIYVTAFAAALLSLNLSFASVRRAGTGSRSCWRGKYDFE